MKMQLQAYLLILFAFNYSLCAAQTGQDPYEARIKNAGKELQPALRDLSECLGSGNYQNCISDLVAAGTSNVKKFIIADVLYDIDSSLSFKLHKEAWLSDTGDLHLALEYAMELHRSGHYAQAIPIYKRYLLAVPKDIRTRVWLADCYLNTGDVPQATREWKAAWDANEKTYVDNAVFVIHGYDPQIARRDSLRMAVRHGNHTAAYALAYLDMNWATDWWNNDMKEAFLEHDLQLMRSSFGEQDKALHDINNYVHLKDVMRKYRSPDSVAKVLNDDKLILNGGTIPPDGRVAGDVLNICLMNKLIDVPAFYRANGEELLRLAKANNDNEMLNVYAYLEETTMGHPDTAIERMGWQQMHDERFAISYIMAIAQATGAMQYNNPYLTLAIQDFPDCASLYSIQVNCAQNEHMSIKPMLIALIKKEFNGLRSGPGRHSDALNAYFAALETAQ